MNLSLSGLSCINILAESSTITDVIANPANYSNISVSLQNNCCNVSSSPQSTTNFNPVNTIQSIVINYAGSISIQNIIVQDLNTGILYTIPILSGIITDCTDMGGVLTTLNTYMTTHFTSSDIFTATCNDTTTFIYTLKSNSGKYIAYSINYITLGSTTQNTIYFTYLTSIFVSNAGLVINSTFIDTDLVNYTDGIYNVSIIITRADGTIIQEEGCIFINCTTQCRLAAALPIASNEDAVNMIMSYYGITFTQDCMCDCTYLCKLYTTLNEILNNYLPYNTDIDNACGCSS